MCGAQSQISPSPIFTSKTLPMDAVAPPRHTTVNLSQKSSAATTKPSTKPRTGAANVKPGAAKPLAKPNPSVSKPAGAPKPAPSATAQMGPAQLGKALCVLGLS